MDVLVIQVELRSKNGIKQNVIRIAFKKGSFWHIYIHPPPLQAANFGRP